jgi:hypothetical protein
VYLLSIFGLVSFLLASSSHRSFISGALPSEVPRVDLDDAKKLQAVKGSLRFVLRIVM